MNVVGFVTLGFASTTLIVNRTAEGEAENQPAPSPPAAGATPTGGAPNPPIAVAVSED